MDIETVVRVGAAVVAVVYIVRLLRRWVPAGHPAAPVDDLRLVLDLAARLRDAGRTDAVKLCQQLLDELLKPREAAP